MVADGNVQANDENWKKEKRRALKWKYVRRSHGNSLVTIVGKFSFLWLLNFFNTCVAHILCRETCLITWLPIRDIHNAVTCIRWPFNYITTGVSKLQLIGHKDAVPRATSEPSSSTRLFICISTVMFQSWLSLLISAVKKLFQYLTNMISISA